MPRVNFRTIQGKDWKLHVKIDDNGEKWGIMSGKPLRREDWHPSWLLSNLFSCLYQLLNTIDFNCFWDIYLKSFFSPKRTQISSLSFIIIDHYIYKTNVNFWLKKIQIHNIYVDTQNFNTPHWSVMKHNIFLLMRYHMWAWQTSCFNECDFTW